VTPVGRRLGRCRIFRDKHLALNPPLLRRQEFAVGAPDALVVVLRLYEAPLVRPRRGARALPSRGLCVQHRMAQQGAFALRDRARYVSVSEFAGEFVSAVHPARSAASMASPSRVAVP
jgi:hypothetical protein